MAKIKIKDPVMEMDGDEMMQIICDDTPRVVKRWNKLLVLARRGLGAQGHAL